MKAVYFIELTDGTRFYKCDTFWSKSPQIKHSKIHDDSEYDQKRFFESLVSGFKPWQTEELNDEDYQKNKRYEGAKYGYQKVLDGVTGFTLPEDVKLSEPVYLTQIETINKKGEVSAPTIESYKRDTKINQILN